MLQGTIVTALALTAWPLAHAADAPAPAASSSTAPAAGDQLAEVTVTGTRIVRRDYSSPSPVVTVTSAELQQNSEVSIDQAMDQLPQFNPGSNQFSQASNVQATAASTPGIATLNLRGLGSNRTLVLIDGERAQPADASLEIDVNTIPAAALDSVEVVTGGAAATYGADALAGVVNFKLKHNFEGLQVDAQYGETQQQDGRNTSISALMGSNLADNRGNVMLGITFADRTAVNTNDRGWANAANTDPNSPGGAFPGFPGFNLIPYVPGSFSAISPGFDIPTQAAVNSVFSAYPAGTVSNTTPLYFNTAATTGGATIFSVSPGAGGQPAPGYTGATYPNYKYLTNGSLATNNNPDGPISAPLKRYEFFGNGTYQVNDDITATAQAYFVNTSTYASFGTPTPAVNQWGVSIPYNSNPALNTEPVPGELATLLNSRPDPNADWYLSTFPYYIGDRAIAVGTDTYQLSTGLNGKLPFKDWTWQITGSLGETDITTDYYGFLNQAAYQMLISQPNYGAGYSANDGLTGEIASCTSGLNPFVNKPVSADCLQIVDAQLKTTTEVDQRIAEANFQGGGFDLPGGETRYAFGYDYRDDGITFKPDEGMEASNIVSNAIGIFGAQPVKGSEAVNEGYLEADLPVLANLPLVKKFDIDLGYRYSSYDTSAGNVGTWKALFDWQVNNWITFRGGPARANRAPNIAELFTPNTTQVNLWPSGDPCSVNNTVNWGNSATNPNQAKVIALCNQLSGYASGVGPITASYPGLGFYFPLSLDQQVGNPNLKSEDATTYTFGTVLKSPFDSAALSNMTVTVDYYNIDVKNAITPLDSQIIYSQCLNSNGTSNPTYSPTNFYCSLIRRALTGATDTAIGVYANIGYVKTAGFDLTWDWHARLSDLGAPVPGAVSVNLAANYLQSFTVQVATGDPAVDYKGSTGFNTTTGVEFSWKTNLTLGYSIGPADVSVRWRYLPSVENAATVLSPTAGVANNIGNSQFDLFGSWHVTDRVTVRGGIQNLGNTSPPREGVSATNDEAGVTDPTGVYDELGRRFYVGVTGKF